MKVVNFFLDFFLHLDKNLILIIQNFGLFTYLLLFLVIFMETGFVFTPFLPGDSLIFAAGALAAKGDLNITTLYLLMVLAAFAGDTANYWIGHFIGPKAFDPNASISFLGLKLRVGKFLKQEYLHRAEAFYDKHGGKAIVLARFVPIVRTFAPFVAGIGKMHYRRFISFNLVGGILWVTLFLFGGYFFGSTKIVQNNFHYVVVAIILISLLPILFEAIKGRSKNRS